MITIWLLKQPVQIKQTIQFRTNEALLSEVGVIIYPGYANYQKYLLKDRRDIHPISIVRQAILKSAHTINHADLHSGENLLQKRTCENLFKSNITDNYPTLSNMKVDISTKIICGACTE
jgi:hypothetical protein